jgi:hypothetical protein
VSSPLAFSASSEAVAHVPIIHNGSVIIPPHFTPRGRADGVVALLREDLNTVSIQYKKVYAELQARFDGVCCCARLVLTIGVSNDEGRFPAIVAKDAKLTKMRVALRADAEGQDVDMRQRP